MWVPSKVIDWLTTLKSAAETNAAVSLEAINHLREENSVLRSERDLLKSQLSISQVNADWLRFKVNDLEVEKKALLEKAYQIQLPAPQISRSERTLDPNFDPRNFMSFDDVGDDVAREIGLPIYGTDKDS